MNVETTWVDRLARFAFVGGFATVCQFAILIALVESVRMDPKSASSIGFLISAGVNYWLNHRFTFRSNVSHLSAVPRFATTAAVGLLLNYLVMLALTEELAVQYLIAQVVATGISFLWNFFINQSWSFNSRWK
jgi:putative flippase GtrA